MNWLEQASLSPFRALLPKGSQWYLYACDLAQGEQGKAFVDALSDALDVPIAASTNKTGVIEGADTELEYQTYPQSHDSDAIISYLNFMDYPHTLTLADLQNYAQSGGSTTSPLVTTYSNASIINIDLLNVDDYNLELVNQSASLDFTTTADIQALVDAINALYANGATSTAPSLITYHTAGFDELRDFNLNVVNEAVLTNGLTDLSAIQSVITSLNVLVDYALDNSSQYPNETDYAEWA